MHDHEFGTALARRHLLRGGLGLLVAGTWAGAAVAVAPPPGRKPAPPAGIGPRAPAAPVRPVRPPGPDDPIKVFAPDTWGYRLELPADWTVDTPAPYTVVLSGPQGSDAYFAPVSVQNRRAPRPDNPAASAAAVLAAHREALRARYPRLRVIRETLFRPPPGAADGGRADLPPGRQLVVDWPGEGGPVRRWAVARPRPRAAVVHLWTYTAERRLFDAYLPIARAILDGWRLLEP
ncbi:hypothetical protein [Roseospira goensis]|uniref:DUF1795 domain-containing protein n=1 Tax=Roseospira goensis TaxID=391922 RepID=A0A7W6RZ69_9PROT|nr:hypothetical protein [Roseospira goensis]MBB4285761.1 hypothetical protein [Roseospira goensis]